GAEVAGAYKNVIAIAAGVCDGLGLGNNARAALITRGLAEMTRFGVAFGAKLETFLGLSGVGDLFLTATSEKSRNYRVGLLLAQGKTKDEIISIIGETAEGIETARAVLGLAAKNSLYTPIAAEVVSLLDGGIPKESIQRLLTSSKREEF
ncbi:MAG: glycerol-3-phosphate dehydrogenase, partial [Campylobacterales bacterium]|nr:glycerol-3-phosphate dehydrogenase [Campylobacterales bacterium]